MNGFIKHFNNVLCKINDKELKTTKYEKKLVA